jgi:hypothetical protein
MAVCCGGKRWQSRSQVATWLPPGWASHGDPQPLHLLAQAVAGDAQEPGGLAAIAVALGQGRGDQLPLELVDVAGEVQAGCTSINRRLLRQVRDEVG